MRSYRSMIIVGIVSLLFVSCGTSGIFRQPSAIKPLAEYDEPVTRDMAQMLYPGFQEIQKEIRSQFADNSIQLREDGLRVIHQSGEQGYPEGYYTEMRVTVEPHFTRRMEFLGQAQTVTRNYLDPILVAVSLDWNTVFSPSFSGVIVDFRWVTEEINTLRFILDGNDVQSYLNAQMTLQELVDRNWVQATHGSEQLGRIELNALIS